jgi:hypothetical protein
MFELVGYILSYCVLCCVLFSNALFSSKVVDKKEMLRTVSNIGIYCSSYKVGTVYLV